MSNKGYNNNGNLKLLENGVIRDELKVAKTHSMTSMSTLYKIFLVKVLEIYLQLIVLNLMKVTM